MKSNYGPIHDASTCPLCSSGGVFILITIQVWEPTKQKFVNRKVHPNNYSLN